MTKNSNTLLSADSLTCIREERILFETLNFEISAGEIIQVEGPNGAGKTSLLRILAGLSAPYDGTVYFNQRPINQEREHYNSNMLYIGHLAGIKGEMSAQENLAFNLSLRGLDHTNAEDGLVTNDLIEDDLVESTLAKVNLLGFEDALASHLSAGQHRRIALAQLWLSQAPIWILDEPFTAIDKLGVEKLERLFIQHTERGGCIILTTHQDLNLPSDLVKKLTLAYRFF